MNKRILLILLLGLALRLTGISFGLPHLYHADEPIVVNHALAYGSGDLNPHFFNIPPLTSYLLFLCYGFYYAVGSVAGHFHHIQDFENLFYSDPSSFYLIARVLFGALLGTASIELFYRSLKKHFGILHAEIAALLFSVYFLHVRDSHYIYADIPLIFAMLMGFSSILDAIEVPGLKNCLKTGLWIGIAAAFKYNGAVLLLPFFLSLGLSRPEGLIKKLIFPALLCTAAFFLLNPYALLDASYFLRELAEQGKSQNGAGWLHHFDYSLIGSAGFPMTAAALSGLILVFQKKDLKRIMFASFALIYYLLLVFKGQPYDRYVLPLVPVMVFFASDFILTASQNRQGVRKGILLLLLIGVCLPSVTRCLLWNQIMHAKDVRTETQEWIETNIPSGETIAMDWEFFMPRLSMSKKQLELKKQAAADNSDFSEIQRRRLERMIQLTQSGRPQYELYSFADAQEISKTPFLLEKPKTPYDLNLLKAKGIHYAVIGTFAKDKNPALNHFYRDLREQGKLIAEFTPYRELLPFYRDLRTREKIPAEGKPVLPAHTLDAQPLTGGPFLLSDLKARKSNGQPLQVYKIQ